MRISKKLGILGLSAFLLTGLGLSLNQGVAGVSAARGDKFAVLDATTKAASNNTYNNSWDYGDWTINYGSNNGAGWAYLKMGGKSTTLATSNPCTIAYKNQVTVPVESVTVNIIAGSLPKAEMSVTSWGLYVYSDSAMSTQVDYVAGGTITSSAAKFTFEPTAGADTDWAKDLYYKVSFDLANTSTKNGIIWLDNVSIIEGGEAKVLTGINVTTKPTKTSYIVGEDLDTTGILITGTYEDTTTGDVTDGCTYSPTVLNTVGEQTITVTHTESTLVTSFDVTVGTSGTNELSTVITGEGMGWSSTGFADPRVTEYGNIGYEDVQFAIYTSSGVTYISPKKLATAYLTNVTKYARKINKIIIVCATDITTEFAMYAGNTLRPTTNAITPTVVDTSYTYDFADTYDYFSLNRTAIDNFFSIESITIYISDDALLLANSIMEANVEGQCTTLYPLANARLLALSTEEQAIFNTTGTDEVIVNARTRLAAWKVAVNAASGNNNTGSISTNVAIIISVAVAVLGLTSAGVILVLKKKKETF